MKVMFGWAFDLCPFPSSFSLEFTCFLSPPSFLSYAPTLLNFSSWGSKWEANCILQVCKVMHILHEIYWQILLNHNPVGRCGKFGHWGTLYISLWMLLQIIGTRIFLLLGTVYTFFTWLSKSSFLAMLKYKLLFCFFVQFWYHFFLSVIFLFYWDVHFLNGCLLGSMIVHLPLLLGYLV